MFQWHLISETNPKVVQLSLISFYNVIGSLSSCVIGARYKFEDQRGSNLKDFETFFIWVQMWLPWYYNIQSCRSNPLILGYCYSNLVGVKPSLIRLVGDSPKCLVGMCCQVFEALNLANSRQKAQFSKKLYLVSDLLKPVLVSISHLQLTRNGFNLCIEKSFKLPILCC